MFISHLHSTLPKDLDLRVSISFLGPIVDTVVMNPPFGTRRNGADMDFLSAALKVYLDFLFIYFLYPFLEL
jgi:predicted RNA methylase